MELPLTETSAGIWPKTESYLRRWARVGASVTSFIQTNSILSRLPREALRMFLPIRPKPLIATLTI